MAQKEHIQNFLKLNGVPLDAPDEEIRAALKSAHWAEKDVENALQTLQGVAPGENAASIASRQLFHSDSHIEPKTLSSLLGVTVRTKHKAEMYKELDRSKRNVRTFVTYVLVFGFLAIAVGFFIYALWYIYKTSAF